MRTTFWLLFAILLSGLALYSSPTLDWRFSPSPSEAPHATPAIVKATPMHTTMPAQKPAVVATPRKTATTSPQQSASVETTSQTTAPLAPVTAHGVTTDIEQNVFADTNAERIKNGLPALTEDARLADLARAHSADMLTNNYFDHTDKNGCSSSCRADAVNYAWMALGENIYMTEGYTLSPSAEAEMVVQGWMNSPGHRANILGEQFTQSGVGVAVQGDTVYVTAMYSKPR